MAKKKITDEFLNEIKKNLNTKRLIIGTQRTMKKLKAESLEKIFLSSNCPDKVREDVEYYTKMTGSAEVINLNYPNDELGVICKKPFSISVLGLLKV